MAREPVKTPKLTIATPIRPDLFKNVEVVKPKPNEKMPDPRLAEVVAALPARRKRLNLPQPVTR